MYVLVTVLILIVSILLGLIVLVQNSKGGGLVSDLGSANQMMGVRKTADFLEKTTWTLSIILVVLCLVSSIIIPRKTVNGSAESIMMEQIQNEMPSVAAPAASSGALPATTPIEDAE